MDPEFQRVMFRVLAIGGFIGVIAAIGVFFAFRSFGENRTSTARGPLLFLVLGFIVACCLILLRMSFVR